jgi:hypothetical protein
VPGAQSLHVADPGSENWPTAHAEQTMLPGVDANVPAMQGVQGSLPVSLKDPAGHRSAAATVAKRPEAKMTAGKNDARMGAERPIREALDQGVFHLRIAGALAVTWNRRRHGRALTRTMAPLSEPDGVK